MFIILYDIVNMNVKKNVLLIFLLFFVISCSSYSQDEYYRTFDLPLIKKDMELKQQGDYKAVIALNKQYLKIANQKKYEEGKALCYINMAKLSMLSESSKNSLFLMKRAEEILKHSDSGLHKAILYNGYALLNRYLNMFDNALHYNAKAIRILKDMDNVEGKDYLLSRNYSNRGDFLFYKGQMDSSLVYFHKYRNLIKDINIECVLSEYHLERNNLDSAGIYIREAQNMINVKNNKLKISNYDVFHFWLIAGKYYTKTGDYRDAEDAYIKAQDASKTIQKVFGGYVISELYKSRAEYYKKTGDSINANYYTSQYIQEKDKMADNLQGVTGLAIKAFVTDMKVHNQQENKNIWLFIVLLVIVGALIGIYTYKQIRALQSKRRVLKYETEELQSQIMLKKQEEVIALAKKNDSVFLMKFQEVYPDFIMKLQEINPDLETSELTFAALIKLNFSSKEIATYTFIQHTSVQQRKRRLRKRLNIPSDIDLYQFFNDL